MQKKRRRKTEKEEKKKKEESNETNTSNEKTEERIKLMKFRMEIRKQCQWERTFESVELNLFETVGVYFISLWR